MLKRVKSFDPKALIADDQFRIYLETFESELLRGISTVVILHIVQSFPDEGIYAYKLLKTINQETNSAIFIDEGTLYPLLKKMERDRVLKSEKKMIGKRSRNYYFITPAGGTLLNYMKGIFGKILEGISPMIDVEIEMPENKYFFCPNCANKIHIEHKTKLCEICGFFIEDRSQEESE